MSKKLNLIASIGLATGAVFGLAGSIFKNVALQISCYEISSVGLIVGAALLTVKFLNEKNEFIATGFLLLTIAEAVMSAGTALGQIGGQSSFGAGMALYIPAFLFISIPKEFPLLPRMTGILAAIPFLLAASKIYVGQTVLSTSALPGAGYGLLTITIAGWIFALLKGYKIK